MRKAKVQPRVFYFTSQRLCREVHDRVYDRWPYYQEGQTCLHIGHLVSLERSNFPYVLGSSGVAR
jgi:transposase